MQARDRIASPRAELMRSVDVDVTVRLARALADEFLRQAADPDEPLTMAERRGLLTIASAVDARITRWAGLPARSPEAQLIIDKALAAVLP